MMLATSSGAIAPPRFLGDELAQVGGRIAEGGVAGELGLADRLDVGADPRPVHVPDGEPAGLEVRRQQHAVEAAAGRLAAGGVQGAHLGDDVPRRVESPRLTTPIGASSRSASSNSIRPIRAFSSTASASGRLRVLVRTKQVAPAWERPAASASGSHGLTTSTPWTVWDPVGSSSRTAIRRPASARASGPAPGVRLHPRRSRFAVGSARAIADVRRPGGRR